MSDAKLAAWRTFNKRDGRWYRMWREPGSRKVFKMLEHRWMWEVHRGPIPAGHDIHHVNHDATDNRIENLEAVARSEHREHHNRDREDVRVIAGERYRCCQRCHVYKPEAVFSVRRAGTRHGYCKRCVAEYVRDWKRANEHARQWRRDYYVSVEKPARAARRIA